MVSHLESICSLNCLAESLYSMSMSNLLTLNSLGRICGSSHSNEVVVLDRVKRKNSVRRMSIIEDGEIAEVLYLIPKQSMMEQLPFLDPSEYILCEKLAGMPAGMSCNDQFTYLYGRWGWYCHWPVILCSNLINNSVFRWQNPLMELIQLHNVEKMEQQFKSFLNLFHVDMRNTWIKSVPCCHHRLPSELIRPFDTVSTVAAVPTHSSESILHTSVYSSYLEYWQYSTWCFICTFNWYQSLFMTGLYMQKMLHTRRNKNNVYSQLICRYTAFKKRKISQ